MELSKCHNAIIRDSATINNRSIVLLVFQHSSPNTSISFPLYLDREIIWIWALKGDMQTKSENLPNNNNRKVLQILAESIFLWRVAVVRVEKTHKILSFDLDLIHIEQYLSWNMKIRHPEHPFYMHNNAKDLIDNS